jgi:hypothetical protein
MPRYGRIDTEYATRLATADPATDGPVYMLNLMKYREVADYKEADGEPVTGREADDRYAPVDVLRSISARVCFTADVIDASEDWDRVAVVRYPTRKSFIDMQSRRDFQEKHVHKDAGMDHTVVVGTIPRSDLPSSVSPPDLVLLELWNGTEPPPALAGAGFDVEGTILGDGRTWSGVRYARVDSETPRPSGSERYQVLVLRPTIERWS